MTVDRERDLALVRVQAAAAVDEIDDALSKLGNGTTGCARAAGGCIAKGHDLEALPYATLCIAARAGGCQTLRVAGKGRPAPPGGRLGRKGATCPANPE